MCKQCLFLFMKIYNINKNDMKCKLKDKIIVNIR